MVDKIILSIREPASEIPFKNSGKALLGILLAFLPLFVFGITGTRVGAGTSLGGMLITLGYILAIVVASLVLKLQASSWRQIGLAQPGSWLRTALLGFVTFLGTIVLVNVVQWVALSVPGLAVEPVDLSRFNPLTGNLPLFLLYLLLAWTTITFGEEMFFRAFLISQLEAVFQGIKIEQVLAVLISFLAFGSVHYQEGVVGMLSTAAMGFLFALIYLRTRRNLWVTIIAHGLANTLRFVFIFIGTI
jgi:hypothetical protein